MSLKYEGTIRVGGKLLDLSRPVVMGILNVTPDSFYASSREQTSSEIARRAEAIVGEGGSVIDVGGCSTRPGYVAPPADEEMSRLRTGLAAVRRACGDVAVSVDTFRPDVARMCVEEFGACIINDVTEGGRSLPPEDGAGEVPAMFRMAARLKVPYILTSVQPDMPSMLMAFAREVQQLHALGVADVMLDPGFGFGKTLEQNYVVLSELERLQMLRLPVLAGMSRKSMITRVLGTTADEALNGTTALNMIALMKGASLLRVHDVRQAVECVELYMHLKSQTSNLKSQT